MVKAITARTLQASATNTAGSTTTGTALDTRAGFGMLITGKITNGATGPTVACNFILEVSHDNTNFKTFISATSQLGNAVVTEWVVDLPPTCSYVRSKFVGNTGQSVTVECLGSEWTTLS